MTDKTLQGPEIECVARGWASRDPLAAMEWIRQHPQIKPDDNWHLLRGALTGWVERDLPAATAFIFEHDPQLPLNPSEVAQQIAGTVWDTRGPEGLTHWVDSLKNQPGCDDAFMKQAFLRVRALMSQSADPAGSVAFLRNHAGTPWCKADDVEAILRGACDGDPQTILQASIGLGPDPATGRHFLLTHALSQWSVRNPEAPVAWLHNHAGSAVYDDAAASYAEFLAPTDAASAMQWAQTIKGESLRQETIRHFPAPPEPTP
jgi:hypothetical protein